MEDSLFQSTTLYILCNSELVLVQQILLPLFSYHTFARLALKTIKMCRQPTMCQVPALPSSHIMHPMLRQTSLRYISLDQVGQKGKMVVPRD